MLCEFGSDSEEERELYEFARNAEAAYLLQKFIRGQIAKQRLRLLRQSEHAVTDIQRVFRGHLFRRKRKAEVLERETTKKPRLNASSSLKSVDDIPEIAARADVILRHNCDERCKVRAREEDEPENFRCRKMNSVNKL